MTPRGGRFIVLEGIDGSGTTTQAKRLRDALEARGTPVCLTCEPTPGPVGQLIRQALRRELTLPETATSHTLSWSAMALLFAADRLDHVDTVVLPALALGKTVVSDRYVVSSLAYQSVTSPEGGGSIPWIREINRRALRADLTLVLDVDDDVAAERRAQRAGPVEIYEARELQRRLVDVYAHAEDLVPGDPIVHIADGTPDEVAIRVLAAALRA